MGRAPKTDRVDARLIAEYAATIRPAERLARSAEQHGMKELSSRRDQLIASIAAEKKRLRRVEHEVVRASVESQTAALEAEVKRTTAAIKEAASKDESTRTTAAILESIPGGGKLMAQLLAIELPELDRLDAKLIALLARVAPHPVESGKSVGSAYIRGGRPRVRLKLYMSSFNARRYNPQQFPGGCFPLEKPLVFLSHFVTSSFADLRTDRDRPGG